MGTTLKQDDAVADTIRAMFAARGRRMADNNLRQALVPVGATVIPQTRGTAPGLICPVGDAVIYAVPGVPHEMQDMLTRAVLPDLRRRSGDTSVIASRVLRTWGESESGLDERLRDVITRLDDAGNPTLAFLASGWEGLKVRLTAKADTLAAAEAVLAGWEAEIRDLLGPLVFGADDDTMESVTLDLLRARDLSLGLAESVTGGLVAARLTSVPGASEVFRGSIVSYASEVKYDLLGVADGPVVSAEAAAEMAAGARRALGADIGLALTGVAGPDEQEGQPVGTLHVGIASDDGVSTASLRLPGTRDQMRQFSVISSLDLLRRQLLGLG
jgi:nicotinamide-nucleotide amidase